MGLTVAAGLILCPVCSATLEFFGARGETPATVPRTARCAQRHSFDVARSGYLNLSGKGVPENADTTAMVQARQRFLASGLYDVIVEAILANATGRVLLEAGAGPAFYLARCVDAEPDRVGVAVDVSPAAARVAAKAHPRIASLVADLWEGLPLADGVVDTVLSLFAPRNLPEFARVLAPGGTLVVVVPNPGHLTALRRRFDLLRIHPGKVDDLVNQMPEDMVLLGTSQIGCVIKATADHVADIIAMGPNARHPRHLPPKATTIDIDVSILSWRKDPSGPAAD
jgi:23S rRNA (guanine745-N1)-methyltransferase